MVRRGRPLDPGVNKGQIVASNRATAINRPSGAARSRV
jgi:hypothetical protein